MFWFEEVFGYLAELPESHFRGVLISTAKPETFQLVLVCVSNLKKCEIIISKDN